LGLIGQSIHLCVSRNNSNAADHSSYLQGPAGSHRHLTSLCQPGKTISKKGSPYSITERRFPELIPVLGSQPAGEATTWLPSHPFTVLACVCLRLLTLFLLWLAFCSYWHQRAIVKGTLTIPPKRYLLQISAGNESVPKIMLNDTIKCFLKLQSAFW